MNRITYALLALALCLGGVARAVDNPVTAYHVYLDWQDAQGNKGSEPFDAEWWFTQYTGWDGVYTSHNSVKFEHLYVQDDWPQNGHTAEEAKRFFDDRWEAHQTTDSVGTANPKYNCLSYAFGRTGYWVNADSEILSNDYQNADRSNATVASWGGHACKVTDREHHVAGDCNWWTIKQIKMKDGGSAIFTFTYTDWDLKLSPHYGIGDLKKPK